MENWSDKFKAFVVSIIFITLFTFVCLSANRYTRIATYCGNYRFVDEQGYEWVYMEDKENNFEVGKRYSLSMFNNTTDNIITDDVILRVNEI